MWLLLRLSKPASARIEGRRDRRHWRDRRGRLLLPKAAAALKARRLRLEAP